jgi:hypothetical protein
MDHRLQYAFAALGVMIVGAGLAYLWVYYIAPQDKELRGLVAVYEYDPIHPWTGGGCTKEETGPGEFGDLRQGAPIKIMDEAGSVLAQSELGAPSESLGTCYFAFRVGPIDESSNYTVQVAERAPTTFTADELEQRRWQVTFDFGGQASSDP